MNGVQGSRRGAERAFSLVEMLTVIAVIAIVLGILLPALAATRNSARKSATQTLQKTIGDACQQFAIDQRRQAGYFNQRDMGSNANAALGFTQMQNLVLDLAGGVTSKPVGTGVIEVGPTNQAKVRVAIEEIGSPSLSSRGNVSKAYFRPDPKYFVVQSGEFQSARSDMEDKQFPMVVDPWNQPMLAWVADDVPSGSELFSADEATTGSNPTRAKFYWASNAGVLNATGTGRSGISQRALSMIGSDQGTNVTIAGNALTARAATLAGFLANPSGGVSSASTTAPFMPLVPRGSVIIQSAGANEIFVGNGERGAKVSASENPGTNFLRFKPNQDPIAGGSFDDVVTAYGN